MHSVHGCVASHLKSVDRCFYFCGLLSSKKHHKQIAFVSVNFKLMTGSHVFKEAKWFSIPSAF